MQSRRIDDAEAELRQGLTATADDPQILVALARLELRKQLAKSAGKRSFTAFDALLQRVVKAAPRSLAVVMLQAERAAASGQTAGAIDQLTKATSVDKTNPDLWLARGRLLAAMGRVDEALFVLDQASEPQNAGDQADFRILRAQVENRPRPRDGGAR